MSENNRPQGWGKDHKLPDNWGKQSSGLESKTLSGGVSMSSSEPDKESDIKAEDKVSFSDKARSGAGKLAGIAKKVGGAAKNAAGNAVEYAKSDEAKEKLNAVKSKAKSIADGAGSAFTDLKEKTGNAINERRSSKVESALSDNDISDNAIDDTFAPDTYKDTSSDIVHTENSYDDRIDVSDLNPPLDSESGEPSDTLENGTLSTYRQDIPDTSTEDDEDSAWGNSSLPFKKSEPVSSSDTNSKTNGQSNSAASNANDKADVDSVHDVHVQNVKQPENISSPAPTAIPPQNQGYIIQKKKTIPVLIIVIIVLVLVIGVLSSVFFMMSRKENNEPVESNSKLPEVTDNSEVSEESESSEELKGSETSEPPTESKVEETTVDNNAEENIKAPSNTKPSVNIPCSKSDVNSNYVNIINSMDFSKPNKGFIIDIDNDGINEMIIPDTTEMNYVMYYFDGSSIKSCSFGGFMGLDNFDIYKVDGEGNENYIYYRSGISYKMLQGYFSFESGDELQIFIDYPEKNGSYFADWTIDFNQNENYAKGNEPVDTFYAQPADCHQKLMSALPHYGFNVYEDTSYIAINGLYKDELINKLSNNDNAGKKTPEDIKPNTPAMSNAELGRMYNAFYIESIVGGKGGGYIEDYNGDGTDDLICSVANAGYAVFYYKNGDLEFNVIPNTENYRYDEPLFGMKSQYYAWDELPDKCLEKAISCGFTANKDFYIGNTYQIGYVKTKDIDGTLNLRSAPSTDSDVLVQLPNGKLFNVIPSPTGNYGVYDDNGWYYISVNQNGNNYTGYISSDYAVAFEYGI